MRDFRIVFSFIKCRGSVFSVSKKVTSVQTFIVHYPSQIEGSERLLPVFWCARLLASVYPAHRGLWLTYLFCHSSIKLCLLSSASKSFALEVPRLLSWSRGWSVVSNQTGCKEQPGLRVLSILPFFFFFFPPPEEKKRATAHWTVQCSPPAQTGIPSLLWDVLQLWKACSNESNISTDPILDKLDRGFLKSQKKGTKGN